MKGVIKSIVNDYAASVIKAVMDKYRVGEKDFRKSNFPHCVKARSAAIRRLSADGFSNNEISQVMRISPDTVSYRLNPKVRARRIALTAKRRGASAPTRTKAELGWAYHQRLAKLPADKLNEQFDLLCANCHAIEHSERK